MSTTATSTQRPSTRQTGCYVYGIVPADAELPADAYGVGAPPARVTLVPYGDIAALVSTVDVGQPIGRPDDFIAHERLLDTTAANVPVLPLRFGAVVTNTDAVAEDLLAAHHDDFAKALAQLAGRVQYVVRCRYVEPVLLAEILAENPEAASLRTQMRDLPTELTHDVRIRLGELVSQAIEAKRGADTTAVVDALAEHCVASAARPASHEHDAAHVALLAEKAHEAPLAKAVDQLARDWDGRVTVQLLGPLAPYDFVTTLSPGHGA
ncbi:GvpL/GvpF family gas vesicle protein [Micromonospora sp. CPCC 206061]|uniref:GvpL/GvpF family gas vesicle protein n=1 Tax=Micromonospora sp. CPCC 206061 TaxID=3122410 RepID=UPI002FF09657